uniref:NAD(P)-dependent dehydrogenase, short-chain alcohol dehydrogenase family n=2 Tax=Candidatus Kentrum sp. FM TaxID=2126340 RepID=A0A450TW52_9GAMM|nr:MAG: NAD(P)-dependent dehydrogenase, short-chain alcohol dehydrogenase family [Candidatus Kentron sp. FM]VFK17817.1 MAG: NAD(P)-dependent dehydrogenase, short-chain alcohol dehydrogenase family [Candidatus Kentron sp. FM]
MNSPELCSNLKNQVIGVQEQKMTTDINNRRIALVTGASRGMGFAIAKRLAMEGVHVVATARNKDGLDMLGEIIQRNGEDCTLVPLDLSDSEGINELCQLIDNKFGKLDILVGNAGILGPLSPFHGVTLRMWEEVFAVNVTANFHLIKGLDKLLRKSSAGRAVFISSGILTDIKPSFGAYIASKSALEGMILSYAGELAGTLAKVNVVRLGVVVTDMARSIFSKEGLEKLPKPDEVSGEFLRYLSPDNILNGEIIDIFPLKSVEHIAKRS